MGLVALLIAALLLAAYALLPPRTPSKVRCTGIAGVVLTFLAGKSEYNDTESMAPKANHSFQPFE